MLDPWSFVPLSNEDCTCSATGTICPEPPSRIFNSEINSLMWFGEQEKCERRRRRRRIVSFTNIEHMDRSLPLCTAFRPVFYSPPGSSDWTNHTVSPFEVSSVQSNLDCRALYHSFSYKHKSKPPYESEWKDRIWRARKVGNVNESYIYLFKSSNVLISLFIDSILDSCKNGRIVKNKTQSRQEKRQEICVCTYTRTHQCYMIMLLLCFFRAVSNILHRDAHRFNQIQQEQNKPFFNS